MWPKLRPKRVHLDVQVAQHLHRFRRISDTVLLLLLVGRFSLAVFANHDEPRAGNIGENRVRRELWLHLIDVHTYALVAVIPRRRRVSLR